MDWINNNEEKLRPTDYALLKGVMFGNLGAIVQKRNPEKGLEIRSKGLDFLRVALTDDHPVFTKIDGVVSVAVQVEKQLDAFPILMTAA